MKLGLVVDGNWNFVNDLLPDLQARYETRVFRFKERRLPAWSGRINNWNLRRSLGQLLRDNDTVFFEWAGPYLALASHLQEPGRMVVRLHSYELFEFAHRIQWESVEHVILVSHAMQKQFGEMFPVAADKTTVVYNGVDLSKFRRTDKRFSGVIGMLANLVPIKRIYEVILAIHELNRDGCPLTLRIAGPRGPGADNERYYVSLLRLVRMLGLEQQVSFLGPTSDSAGFLSGVDIFISNSFWEGQQVALLEAMAAGCYCLSHAWNGVAEILPEEYLYVTDGEMREKIRHAYAMVPAVRKQHQERMRSIACEKFDLERNKSEIRTVLDTVTAGMPK